MLNLVLLALLGSGPSAFRGGSADGGPGPRDGSIFAVGSSAFRGGSADGGPGPRDGSILVVGSANADIIINVPRLPTSGETICTEETRVVAGGKGCNQAIAAARLGMGARFVGQLGDDEYGSMLTQTLLANGVDASGCVRQPGCSGQGLVFLEESGAVSSIVVSGANGHWPLLSAEECAALVRGSSVLLLQREIPERVNEAMAAAACAQGIPVMQDVGGHDRPISEAHLRHCSLLSPNQSELQRLTGMPVGSEPEVLAAVESLRARGAQAVLVTLGGRGAILVSADGSVLRQPAALVPGGVVVDETGAGDCFRAAFAVGLAEGRAPEACLQLAAAAGAIAVSVEGAVPAIPARAEVEAVAARLRGGGGGTDAPGPASPPPPRSPRAAAAAPGGSGLEFASRLNSMKERPELWTGASGVLGWVARQGTVRGLGLVDFNFPQHLEGLEPDAVRSALAAAGLRAGAICLRYPKRMQAGALTHPDPRTRAEAVEMTIEAGRWAKLLGADELVVWSAFDGYDYSLQADYTVLWQRVVDGFRQVCDAHPELKVSLEFKPTDENTRFFAVPSTGAALLLVHEIDRPNMGLTLDVGHCLAAGENPAQSAAMVGRAGKLFGMQLNDGYTRIGAEDGLMFGSVHPLMALELCFWLQEIRFKGHVYFDTFPRNECPVREAELNIRTFERFWGKANRLRDLGIKDRLKHQDALGTLELLELLEPETAETK